MKTSVLFLLIVNIVFSQSWNAPVNLEDINSDTKVASCVNSNGIHTIYWENDGSLQFVKINSTGSAGSPVTIENNIGAYASICTYNNILYAVYEKNGVIKIVNSTNNGVNWNTSFASRNVVNSSLTGLFTVTDDRGIHIAWSEDYGYYAEVYYERYQLTQSVGFYNFKNVTDGAYESGGHPTIALSANKVHIGYHTGSYYSYGTAMNRDYVWSTDTWQDAIEVPLNPYIHEVDYSHYSQIAVVGSTLHVVYHGYNSLGYFEKLRHFTRPVNGTTWTFDSNLDEAFNDDEYPLFALKLIVTADSTLHLFYKDDDYAVKHLTYSGSTWSDETPPSGVIRNDNEQINAKDAQNEQVSFCATGNDIFAVFNHNVYPIPGNKLRYRQYDASPVPPSSMSIATQTYFTVSWAANPEPDIQYYEIWRKVGNGSYYNISTTTSTSFVDPDYAAGGSMTLSYKTRSKDIGNNLSDYSSVVSVNNAAPFGRTISVVQIPDKNRLEQNYPNPFNPTTSIRYQLKDESHISIKVFTILGAEVCTLVNEVKPAGYYNTEFDASQLPSGVYLYRISVGNYSDTRKMVLSK
jgi:hypothetical protein